MSLKEQLKIMVVDDTSVSRGLVTRSLDNIGIRHVSQSEHPKKALAMLEASPVHIVLSDFNMPDMDGLDLLLALRKNQKTAKVGFIMMSGSLNQMIVDLGKRLGMNNFLNKPFSDGELKKCLESVTGPL